MSLKQTDTDRTADFPGSGAIEASRTRVLDSLTNLSKHDNAGVAMLAAAMLGYIQVLWMGKPVRETALAPYYAAIGEHKLTPESWDTRADLTHRRRMGVRGQTSNLTQLFLGVLIAGIIAIRVFIPTINDSIASSNVSGTTETILDMLGLFAALLLLVSLAAPLMRST